MQPTCVGSVCHGPDAEREAVDGKTLVNADHPQVIEIWNNVFIQFNRGADGRLLPAPAQHPLLVGWR